MAIGHFLMAVESLFFPALLFLILGNGAFKPNISTQVGSLYPPGDPRRDRAFTIFYMGINLGAFFSPLVCGTLGQRLGWHYGFGAAGVGMVAGLCIYLFGQRTLAPDLLMRTAGRPREREPLTRDEWRRVWALVLLCALNIVFWGIYEQQGNTLQLWADRNTNWNFLGLDIPSTWFQAFNPFLIFLLAPLLNIFWSWQSRRRSEPSSIMKMALGCFLAGASYVVMMLAAHSTGPEERGSVAWLARDDLHPDHWRTLSLADRPFARDEGGARWNRLDDDGYLVSFELFRQLLSRVSGHFLGADAPRSLFPDAYGLGLSGGVAIWLLGRPLERAVVEHEGSVSRQ